ncbi:Thiosulfate sulfurtransferase YnjE [invertebrate metagenome]|uniref:Thiosulfate sulfurtransferase YnjE n=1 Tax=invertebrate metagenome TaxID=1711999 RepID=A0A2H9T577_9ZZZZ
MLSSRLFKALNVGCLLFLLVVFLPHGQSTTLTHDYTTIDVRQFVQLKHTSHPVVIDARNPDAFNGWAMDNENRGGHIPEARLLSADWIVRDLSDLNTAYKRTGITSEDLVVIYGYNKKQSIIVADWLVNEKELNPDNISVLQGGYNQWSENKNNPVDRLPNYHLLMPATELNRQINTTPELKIVEIGWDGGKGKNYRKGHIPAALYWNDLEFEHPPIYELNSVQSIRDSLKQLGITATTPVVVYSTESIGSARGAAVMKYAGIKNVTMLNGGKEAWEVAGFPLEKGWVEPIPSDNFGTNQPGDSSVVININQAKKLRLNLNGALVSIRSWKEYTGQISGYDYFQKRGRITGALWGQAGDSAWDMNAYHNPDNTMRSSQEIQTFWNQWGIYPDRMQLAFYCGNGWRASEVWWYAQVMGYTNNSIYSSGWMRWRNDPANPISTGILTRKESIQDWQMASGKTSFN